MASGINTDGEKRIYQRLVLFFVGHKLILTREKEGRGEKNSLMRSEREDYIC